MTPAPEHPDDLPYEARVVVPGVFTAAQCRRIIDTGLAAGTQPAALETGEAETEDTAALDGSIRSSQVAWIPRTSETEWIHAALESSAEQANQRYRFDLTGIEEELQFTAYDRPGAFYTWHQDGLDAGVSRRKLSLVVQLSAGSDHRGGTLEFFALHGDAPDENDIASRSTMRRGSVVAFPSFEYHRVTPIEAGTRYSLVAWVGGPPFR